MKHVILFIDDNHVLRQSMAKFLEQKGFTPICAATGEDGIALVRQKINNFSIALVDYHLPDMTGAQVTARIRELNPDITILGFSDDRTDPVHNEALDCGAISFVNKDASDAKLLGIINRHCKEFERRTKPLTITGRANNHKLIESIKLTGCSNHLVEVTKLVLKYAISDFTVLIRGENGTGKERIARAIHEHSNRQKMPFIAVNCAAIPKDLIASELFGHVKGAFTGASGNKQGKFQAADHGTLFLDEVGDMSLDTQAALLRALQEKIIMPVGSNETQKVDVRVIAATNAPLEDMIASKDFRQDLFYRLNVLPVFLKPLRERPEDIPYLIVDFMNRLNEGTAEKKIILQSDVEKLESLPWPGNVRELEHTIERLFTITEGNKIDIARLNDDGRTADKILATQDRSSKNLNSEIKDHEVAVLKMTLKRMGSVKGAARELGVSRGALRAKIKKYGIKIKRIEEETLKS